MLDDRDPAEGPVMPAASPAEIRRRVEATGTCFIVLDDDPTGTQAIADLPVITRWTVDDLSWAMGTGAAAVYVMTNSRSLDVDELPALVREVVDAALAAAASLGRPVRFVSRSDSTLRGHFPAETDALSRALVAAGHPEPDGVVMLMAFPEAGRVTRHGVHLARQGARSVPIAETDYAADPTFGFTSSHLAEYVEEKSAGRIPAHDVVVISVDDLERGAAHVSRLLREVRGGRVVVFDGADETHLRTASLALDEAERHGSTFLYRVGPPLVRARIGQVPSGPIDRPLAGPGGAGGLVIVGSHVDLTNAQLAELRTAFPAACELEIDVAAILGAAAADTIEAIATEAAAALRRGLVIVTTSRSLVSEHGTFTPLAIARAVSDAVVAVTRRIVALAPPAFVVAKGGITSSDVASKGLGIVRAMARGTLLPGMVSLWEPVEGPAAGVPFVVFPGNVGDASALAEVVRRVGTLTRPTNERLTVEEAR